MALTYIRQNGNYPGSASTTNTFTLDCTGADLVIVGAGDRGLPTGATLNGVPMSPVSAGVSNGAANARQFFMVNPPTGTQTIVVTYGSSVLTGATASAWSGFNNGVVSAGGSGSGNGTSVASSSNTTLATDVVVDFCSHGASGLTVGASQIQISNNFYANSDASSYRNGTGGSFTMTWSTGVASVWAETCCIISPGSGTKVFATWNSADKGANVTLSGGNLVATSSSGAGFTGVRSTIGAIKGKWYWEITCTSSGTAEAMNGVADILEGLNICGGTVHGWGYWGFNGQKYHNGSGAAFGSGYTTQVIGYALDADAGTLEVFRSGVSQGVITLSGTQTTYFAMTSNASGSSNLVCTANFGATNFVYTPPAGFNYGLFSTVKVETTGSATTNTSTTTAAITVSGTNNMLLVAVSDQDNSNNANTNVTGVTCNGVAMTKIDVQAVNAGYGNSISLWGLLGATSGNIVATRNHVQDALAISYTLYSNVDQSTPISSLTKTKGGSTASSFTGTLTTSTTFCWLAMGVYSSVGGDTLSPSSGCIKRISTNGSINSYFDSAGSSPTATSNSIAVADTGSHVYGYVMVEIRPYVAPATTTTYANLLAMLM